MSDFVVTIEDDQATSSLEAQEPSNVVVLQTGYPGPQGPPGDSGSYVHTQDSPALVWTVTHGLTGYPSVTVVDSANSVVEGSVVYLSMDSVQIEFTAPFGGKAFFS